MNEIIEQVNAWPGLQNLSPVCAGFTLTTELRVAGTQYILFSYRHPPSHRSFVVLYEEATKEYLGRVTIGLTEYYDVAFICPDLATLEKVLDTRMEKALGVLAGQTEFESLFRAKKVMEWPYATSLPNEVAGFSLFIAPGQPVRTVNGSYIILDYSDFSAESNLIIYYNIYRDEFFGEIRLHKTPEMVNSFDAQALNDLAEKLTDSLQPTLENLRQRIVRAS